MVDSSEEYPLPDLDLESPGRFISASKSGYRTRYPNNLVVFNGGLYVKSRGHLWSGDMDITRDTPRLEALVRELGEDVYVLRERMDAQLNGVNYDEAIAVFKHE